MTSIVMLRLFFGWIAFNALFGGYACARGFLRAGRGEAGTSQCFLCFLAFSLLSLLLAVCLIRLRVP